MTGCVPKISQILWPTLRMEQLPSFNDGYTVGHLNLIRAGLINQVFLPNHYPLNLSHLRAYIPCCRWD